MTNKEIVQFRIQRYNPDLDDKPNFITYDVPYIDRQGVLDALHYIFQNLDSSGPSSFHVKIIRKLGN